MAEGGNVLQSYRRFAVNQLANLGPHLLPFADVATPSLPLTRLLRLSLFQVSVGMALVLLVGTLNRVMIVELSVPASIVAFMISLPIIFAPFRAFIGFRSDNHVSALGWRRAPYVFRGSMLQFGGFAVMPFALLVLSGYMNAGALPPWVGVVSAAIAFLLVGAGAHIVQTAGLALATDLATSENQAKVVGLMYVMLLLGMMASALIFGHFLADYSPGRLIRVIQGAAVATLILNTVALWKQEPRDRSRAQAQKQSNNQSQDFAIAWRIFTSGPSAVQRLVIIAFGTLGFGMLDVILEPYGGQVLGLSVSTTTKLTAVFSLGGLAGLALASRILSAAPANAMRLAVSGALVGVPGVFAIQVAANISSMQLFLGAIAVIGFGAGLFGHGTLTATMQASPKDQSGLALGAWGAVQATAAGVAMVLAGVVRDLVLALSPGSESSIGLAYTVVFLIEAVFLIAAIFVARSAFSNLHSGRTPSP
ncbi:MAG: PucC family protein [Pseudomonadota bacterium]